ncbi:MAG: 16S rRNA (guanine(527)-N(7))-methyltransferase RsmG [Pseudomonadota bacterium]
MKAPDHVTRDGPLRGVSRETLERLEAYAAILARWNRKINLVSPRSIPDLWSRHIVDSAQLAAFGLGSGRWLDMGTGAGLPGLIVAAMFSETSPETSFTLVEADERKAAFLHEASRAMDLSPTIEVRRIEAASDPVNDIVSARALAPLPVLLSYASPNLAQDGKCLFLKGENHQAELTSARVDWHMRVTTHRSVTDPKAAILCVEELAHA